jgi:hypothetical protein
LKPSAVGKNEAAAAFFLVEAEISPQYVIP